MTMNQLIVVVLVAVAAAAVLSFALTPLVRRFAVKIGAVDVPKDNRRMHKQPVPLLGGLAIFLAFVTVTAIFADIDGPVFGILIGATIIVVLGIFDDRYDLHAGFKLLVQVVAATIAVSQGCVIRVLSNPILFSDSLYLDLGWLSYPVTVIWIVALTNAVNFIDGLDGLSVGVSAISCLSMLVIALTVCEADISILLAALLGACIGFIPYNFNPAKIFMGDTGSTFLGFMLATISVMGLFKLYAVISFAVPFLILGVPIFDVCFAFIRRAFHGINPMHADRSHIHHRLIDMGFNQKQTVAILYMIASVLGVSAVIMTTSGIGRAIIVLIVFVLAVVIGIRVIFGSHSEPEDPAKPLEDQTKPPEDPAKPPEDPAETPAEQAVATPDAPKSPAVPDGVPEQPAQSEEPPDQKPED